jgi:toluene monooxygenase system ferredoxin subunit
MDAPQLWQYTVAMALKRLCSVAELDEQGMAAFYVDGVEVLVVRDRAGDVHALDGICPHESFPLVYGDFDGAVITCLQHMWSFDATTGRGVNPPGCRLEKFHVEVNGDDVCVDLEASDDTSAAGMVGGADE